MQTSAGHTRTRGPRKHHKRSLVHSISQDKQAGKRAHEGKVRTGRCKALAHSRDMQCKALWARHQTCSSHCPSARHFHHHSFFPSSWLRLQVLLFFPFEVAVLFFGLYAHQALSGSFPPPIANRDRCGPGQLLELVALFLHLFLRLQRPASIAVLPARGSSFLACMNTRRCPVRFRNQSPPGVEVYS